MKNYYMDSIKHILDELNIENKILMVFPSKLFQFISPRLILLRKK